MHKALCNRIYEIVLSVKEFYYPELRIYYVAGSTNHSISICGSKESIIIGLEGIQGVSNNMETLEVHCL